MSSPSTLKGPSLRGVILVSAIAVVLQELRDSNRPPRRVGNRRRSIDSREARPFHDNDFRKTADIDYSVPSPLPSPGGRGGLSGGGGLEVVGSVEGGRSAGLDYEAHRAGGEG